MSVTHYLRESKKEKEVSPTPFVFYKPLLVLGRFSRRTDGFHHFLGHGLKTRLFFLENIRYRGNLGAYKASYGLRGG